MKDSLIELADRLSGSPSGREVADVANELRALALQGSAKKGAVEEAVASATIPRSSTSAGTKRPSAA